MKSPTRYQKFEPYVVTVTFNVRAMRDEWADEGWLDQRAVLDAFNEEFNTNDIFGDGFVANVESVAISRDL